MTTPERSLEQRHEALRVANDIRVYRAGVKRCVRLGQVDAVALLVDVPDDRLRTMKAYDLIVCMPKIGRVKANKVFQHARISPSKTIGGLSERQRREVAGLLPRLQPDARTLAAMGT
jgi:hypothetical protein